MREEVVWGVRLRAEVSLVQSILATALRVDIWGDGLPSIGLELSFFLPMS